MRECCAGVVVCGSRIVREQRCAGALCGRVVREGCAGLSQGVVQALEDLLVVDARLQLQHLPIMRAGAAGAYRRQIGARLGTATSCVGSNKHARLQLLQHLSIMRAAAGACRRSSSRLGRVLGLLLAAWIQASSFFTSPPLPTRRLVAARTRSSIAASAQSSRLLDYPKPYTLHPKPYTLNPTP